MRKKIEALAVALLLALASNGSAQNFILDTPTGSVAVAFTGAATTIDTSSRLVLVLFDVTVLTLADADDEVDLYIQMTYDGGTTWTDVENIHFANADNGTTAKKVVSVGVQEFVAADTATDSVDGALADDTKEKAALGSAMRIKTTITGATAPTYAFSARGVFRGFR